MNHNIKNAPLDRPILAYCKHDADTGILDTKEFRMTEYACACEDLPHVNDGWHVIEYIPPTVDQDGWENPEYAVSGFWALANIELDICANPIKWIELPAN